VSIFFAAEVFAGLAGACKSSIRSKQQQQVQQQQSRLEWMREAPAALDSLEGDIQASCQIPAAA
jgi:hypothetical protein